MIELKLSDPVTKVPLVGEKYQGKLEKLEIRTVEDLLRHYPSRYEDYSKVKKIRDLREGETATIIGRIATIKDEYTRGSKFLTKATIADETGQISAIWFNNRYITKTLKEGDLVSLAGRVGESGYRPALVTPEYEKLTAKQSLTAENWELGTGGLIHTGRLVPIYPETSGVTSKWLRSRINTVLGNQELGIKNQEFLPDELRGKHGLAEIDQSICWIHFPKNTSEIEEARKRFAFEELFLLQLRALRRRENWKRRKPSYELRIKNQGKKLDKFTSSLPFELTDAQKRCVGEILVDLEKTEPMNRLLEGDVGSGKTVVAAIAMYAAHLNNVQSALMAPTEVLAEQHFTTIKRFLEPLGVSIGLATGSRKEVPTSDLQPLTSDSRLPTSVVIGTHALLYDSVEFDRLGLVIIDEQHRFGVKQRKKLVLKKAGKGTPHTLTMTATPIPRTLALTAYGDLDLSVIDEMPPGREPVKTWVVPPNKHRAAYEWTKTQVSDLKTQMFIVCPLIEESEHETMQDVKAATAEYERLRKEVFPDLQLGLLHGRMKSREKEEVLGRFRRGEIDILVSTPVVEVGVDIPNANLMVVEGAERFGLASLHQLRGRVGRGTDRSYCLLMAKYTGGRAFKRLKAMEKSNSGFELAEVDLRIRGPGEITGNRQHGLLELKIASLSDTELIQETRKEAERVLEEGVGKYPKLKERIES